MALSLAAEAAKLNRQRFKKAFPKTLLILEGKQEEPRNGDVHYYFRQSSDFLYMSSCDLPDCFIAVGPGLDLLCLPRIDDHHRVWLGETETKASAKTKFGFSRTAYSDELSDILSKQFEKVEKVICPARFKKSLAQLASKKLKIETYQEDKTLATLRVIKNKHEIELMQLAADASSQAHTLVMKSAKPKMKEWEAKDLFDHGIKQHGVRYNSFPTIAGSGANGAVLHYTKEDREFKKGDLLLLDAGGEHHGYAADITRTYPVSGKFNSRQKKLYELVLKAQMESIDMIAPNVWMSDLQENVIRILTKGMKKLGFLKGDLDTLIEKKAISLFYPHGCSHMLGLDVHDVSPPQKKPGSKTNIRSNQLLQEGMVITMEPGLYFIEALLKNKEKHKAFKSLVDFKLADEYLDFGGIRIEDDVLVTQKGFRVLSQVPKTVNEIEALKK